MDRGPERNARRAYGAGLAVTVVLAAVAELLLGRLPAGQGALEGVRDFGYTFTGLCLLGGFLLAQRARKVPGQSGRLGPAEWKRHLWLEHLRVAFACSAGILFGFLYWGLGGRAVERHARTFLALGPPAYLALAVRPSRWGRGPQQPS